MANAIFDQNYVPTVLLENEASGGTVKRAAADNLTKAILTIDYPHHEIHGGDSYSYSENNILNSGEVRKLHLKTPNSEKWCHLVIIARGSGEFNYKLHESPTIVSAGTAVTPRNRNRNKPDASAISAYHTPVHSTSGTKLSEVNLGKTSEANSNDVNIDLDWYEHTNE